MTDKPTQGGKANKQGKILEDMIEPLFRANGFEIVPYAKWVKDPGKYGDELLLKGVPYTTIYGHQGKNEFLIRSKKCELNVRIECKWQQSAGSVDEKYPYLYLNCIDAIPESNIIIVYGGGGMKAGALAWLKSACDNHLYQDDPGQKKEIQVLAIEEFMLWANNTLKG